MNHKRVERIWREEGLRVPKKRGRIYLKDGSCIRLRPLYKDHVWSYDFVENRLAKGRKIKMLTVIDEFSRESLAIRVEKSITSKHVLDTISNLFLTKGIPEYIRSDNGSEFTAKALQKFIQDIGVKTAYITPGSPWENGFIERFNGTLRDELLYREAFSNLNEARDLIENFRHQYNHTRPHASLNYLAPLVFLKSCNNATLHLVQHSAAGHYFLFFC